MNALVWGAVLVGVGLIGTALLDVFITVLHTQIESPISNGLARGVWRLLTSASVRLPEEPRGAVLGWGAPMMIVGIIVFWASLLVLGFGLPYLPLIHDPRFFVIADGRTASPVEDALYQSAVTFVTIGYGDIVPRPLAAARPRRAAGRTRPAHHLHHLKGGDLPSVRLPAHPAQTTPSPLP